MPLHPGKSKEAIADNIKIERKAGRPEKQAIAIAMHSAGKSLGNMLTCKSCDSKTCNNPDHIKQEMEKAYTPENDGDLSKITKAMSDNLIAQLADSESMEKALKASDAMAIVRDAYRPRDYAGMQRPVRHQGEIAARAVHVVPENEVAKGMEYSSCNTCGHLHKSLQKCHRCSAAEAIVEATDWRFR